MGPCFAVRSSHRPSHPLLRAVACPTLTLPVIPHRTRCPSLSDSNLLSNLYSSANLFVDPLQKHFFFRNGADQLHNRSGIEAGESSAPFGYGQPYVCGPMINQTYRIVVFEVGASLVESKSTDLPMYLKNKVTLLPNVPLNYISNSIAFRARFLTTIMRRIVGNQSSYVSIARNNGTPRISVRNSTVGPQEVTNVPPTSNRTQGEC